MKYGLAIEGAPDEIPGGSGLLLLHPSTGETDRIDTNFFKVDTDAFLVISTRTTAREVEQKLEFYDLDPEKSEILDTLSVERGYSRRSSDHIRYVSAPDDLDAIVAVTREFLGDHVGKRRISVDSVSEMIYYAEDDEAVFTAVEELLEALVAFDAVGLFHLSPEVHDDTLVQRYRDRFDGVIELSEDGSVTIDL